MIRNRQRPGLSHQIVLMEHRLMRTALGGHSFHPEHASNKTDLARSKATGRVVSFLREIVYVHRQAQRRLRGAFQSSTGDKRCSGSNLAARTAARILVSMSFAE
jgi:hypothetical protein